MATPNMSLVLPTDHGSADAWDVILDAVFGLVDAHDHTAGKGVQVPSAALKINADVSWSFGGANFSITDLKAIDFAPVAAAGVAGLAGALFINSADNELYYRTTAGVNVKFTNGAALNVTAFTGGIGGDYSAIGALVDFDDASDTYRFKQQVATLVRQFAKISTADLQLFEYKAAGATPVPAFSVRQKSPAALAASYTMQWFAALPAGQVLAQLDAGGTWTASNTIANNTDITLQGTGKIKRGNQTITVPLIGSQANSTATVTTTAGTPGPSITTNGTVYFPLIIPGDLKRVQSVNARLSAGVANATVSLVTGVDAAGVFSAIAGATGTLVAGAAMGIVLTPGAPTLIQAGFTLWLKIVTAGGSQVYCHSAIVTADVP